MASFGYGQFEKLGIQKLRDNNKFLSGVPSFQPSITGTGAGTTSAIPGNGYIYQTFYASGTLTVSSPITADVLIVAGGGPGGSNPAPNFYSSGGGGAGGVSYFAGIPLSTGTYTIVIGGGGGADVNGNPSYVQRPNSTLVGFSTGGGAGAIAYVRAGNPGGSGGGAAVIPSGVVPASTATQPLISNPGGTNYGNAGGLAPSTGAGGGGGAAAAGSGGGGSDGGDGGNGVYLSVGGFSGPLIGLPALAPLNGYFAGGGGGGAPSNEGNGGLGGGGNGSRPAAVATNGTTYSGGGGGGGSAGDTNGALGGSGIVVVRYPVL